MAAKLVAEDGLLKGLVLSLEDGEQWVIGRDPDSCQLLIEDPSASRKHLICRNTPQGIILENLSTTNPVQVNDEEVKGSRLLHHGDAVKIGSGIFRFYTEATAQLIDEQPEQDSAKEEPVITPPPSEIAEQPEQEPQEKPIEEVVHAEEPHEIIEEEVPAEETHEHMEPEVQEEAPAVEQHEVAVAAPPEAEIETPPENPPSPPVAQPVPAAVDEEPKHDSIYEEEGEGKSELAEINFDLLETGRWLLKVVSGPNSGAEFSMQSPESYIIGTDPNSCDIVFHDTSVSRQHARITVNSDETLAIEDLKSRNGTFIDGQSLKEKQILAPNIIVSVGTTSFVVYDREGEMQTIISPLLPSIVKVLQKEEPKTEEPSNEIKEPTPISEALIEKPPEKSITTHLGALLFIGILTGLFIIVGIGTTMLFRSEPVATVQKYDTSKMLEQAMAPFPSVKYSFNNATGRLILVGHVLNPTDKVQLLYDLQSLPFIKYIDDTGVIIDEYVWQETNNVLTKNPVWKGIAIHAPSPGHFVLTGNLQTRQQAQQLYDYINSNFAFLDLLEKKVVVEEDVVTAANIALQNHGLREINVQISNGELTLSGAYPSGKSSEFDAALNDIKAIQGVRSIQNFATETAPEQAMINISDKYDVSGFSRQGGANLSVVINGRILSRGDVLDGMTITSIKPSAIFLEKDGVKFRIDYNK